MFRRFIINRKFNGIRIETLFKKIVLEKYMKSSLLIAKRLPNGKIIGYRFLSEKLEKKLENIDKEE